MRVKLSASKYHRALIVTYILISVSQPSLKQVNLVMNSPLLGLLKSMDRSPEGHIFANWPGKKQQHLYSLLFSKIGTKKLGAACRWRYVDWGGFGTAQ